MGWRRVVVVAISMVFLAQVYSYGIETKWVRMPRPKGNETLRCIASAEPEQIFVGTGKRLYRSEDNGFTWGVIFTCRGEEKGVNNIFVSETGLYLSTRNGAYKSCDNGSTWERVFKGMFSGERNIRSIYVTGEGKNIYVLTETALYKTADAGGTWAKVLSSRVFLPATDGEEDIEERVVFFKGVTRDTAGNLYLSTNKDLRISEADGRTWSKADNTGLYSSVVNSCAVSEESDRPIYLATDKGVFKYNRKEKVWRALYLGLESTNVKGVFFDPRDKRFIWCVTDKAIYRTYADLGDIIDRRMDFLDEPSVQEVQDMAITYAEVSPDKIKKWRKSARLKAILPRITFGLDESVSDTYEIYTNSSDSYSVLGPRDATEGWDLTFTWDLGDLIYNETQTSIDVRSKLMVQLRDEVLNEVTRLYFERKRVKMELASKPPEELNKLIGKELRIEELTASIDALTGGGFSRSLHEN